MSSFYFVRHGQSQANADKEIATDDSPLTEIGIQQARLTAAELKGKGIHQIFASPALRAQQTAEIIAGELGIEINEIHLLKDLKERDLRKLKGKPKQHPSSWYYNEDEADIESQQELLARMKRAYGEIKRLAKKPPVVVVGHAVSGYHLLEIAAGRTELVDFNEFDQMDNAQATQKPL